MATFLGIRASLEILLWVVVNYRGRNFVSRSPRPMISTIARVMYYIWLSWATNPKNLTFVNLQVKHLYVLLTRCTNWIIRDFVGDWISGWQVRNRCVRFVWALVAAASYTELKGVWCEKLSVQAVTVYVYRLPGRFCVFSRGLGMIYRLQFGGWLVRWSCCPELAIWDSSVSKEETKSEEDRGLKWKLLVFCPGTSDSEIGYLSARIPQEMQ